MSILAVSVTLQMVLYRQTLNSGGDIVTNILLYNQPATNRY